MSLAKLALGVHIHYPVWRLIAALSVTQINSSNERTLEIDMDKFSAASFALVCSAFVAGIYLQEPWDWPLDFLIFMSFAGVGALLALYGIYRIMRESTRSTSTLESLILSLVRIRGSISVADVVLEGNVSARDVTRSLNRLVQLGVLKSGVFQGKTVYTLS